MCEGLKCGKAGGKPQSALVAKIGSRKHGWSTVDHEVQVARLVVEATTDSETEFDASQLEQNEETRRLKHKTILRHVNRDIHDARQIAHLQSRTRSGETVDQAHRPQAGTHEGEDRRGKDHLFLSNVTVPQHVKAVLNRLESDAAFSAMSVNQS